MIKDNKILSISSEMSFNNVYILYAEGTSLKSICFYSILISNQQQHERVDSASYILLCHQNTFLLFTRTGYLNSGDVAHI